MLSRSRTLVLWLNLGPVLMGPRLNVSLFAYAINCNGDNLPFRLFRAEIRRNILEKQLHVCPFHGLLNGQRYNLKKKKEINKFIFPNFSFL